MSETIRPTKKQRELLTFIDSFIAEHGYSPSYREIMNGLRYNSVATVALHISNLIKRGHLRKRDHSARSLEVIKSGNQDAYDGEVSLDSAASGKKWLLKETEQYFMQAEQAGTLSGERFEELSTLVRALRILGLDTEAGTYATRLAHLQSCVR